jgi:NTE family protein
MESKRALVISGGGSRGAFAVGALKYLVGELGLEFDVLAGTSTGALIVPLLAAMGKSALPALEKEYTSVTKGDVLGGSPWWRAPTMQPSFYDTDPLRKRIDRHITAQVFAALTVSTRQMAITTVNIHDGGLVYYQTGPEIRMEDRMVRVGSREQLVDAVLASASIPVFMPPVPVSEGAERPADGHVDGGVREYAPIEVAIDAGATEICCLILAPAMDRRKPYGKRFGNVLDVAERAVDLLSEEVGASDVKLSTLYTNAMVYLNAVRAKLLAAGVDAAVVDAALAQPGVLNPFADKRAVSLRIIRPEHPLPGDTLSFDPAVMKANLDYGEECAREQWGAA